MEDSARVVVTVGVLVSVSTDSSHSVMSLRWLILLTVVDVGLLLDRLGRVVLRSKVLASQ